jgi:hypothetical protein
MKVRVTNLTPHGSECQPYPRESAGWVTIAEEWAKEARSSGQEEEEAEKERECTKSPAPTTAIPRLPTSN